MDDVDMRILAAVREDPLQGASAIARRLRLSPSGVRKRIDALEADGVLAGYLAWPSAACLGRTAVGVGFPTRFDADAVAADPDAVWVARSPDDYSGILAYPRDAKAWLARVEHLVGQAPDRTWYVDEPTPAPLGPLEWRVLRACIEEPLASNRDLAAATGLSPKTAGRIRQDLREAGTLKVEPMLRPGRSGAIAFHVYFEAEPHMRGDALAALVDAIPVAQYGAGSYVFARAPDMTTQAERVAALRRTPGVRDVSVTLTSEFTYCRDRVLAWIDEELAAWRATQFKKTPDATPPGNKRS